MCLLYDPSKPILFIMKVDANNFYGYPMSQEMLDGDFEWLINTKCRKIEH